MGVIMQNFKIDPSFGQLVEQEMKRRGDTRAAAAAEMDISTSMLSDLLTGRPRNYSMYTLKKICEYGHFSADRILGLTEPADESSLLQTVNYVTGLSPKAAEMLGIYNRSDWAIKTGRAGAEDFPKIEQGTANRLFEEEDTYTVLASLMLYFIKMNIARQNVVPTDDAFSDAVGFIAKYGFSVVTDLAAAKHQRHIVTEAFTDLIRHLSGEADYKKPDGLDFYDTQEPWEGSIWKASEENRQERK